MSLLIDLAAQSLKALKRIEGSVPRLEASRRALTVAALKLEGSLPLKPVSRLRELVLHASGAPRSNDPLHERFEHLTDAEWKKVLLRSTHERLIDGVEMPGFPDAHTQVLFTSMSNEQAIEEAFTFFEIAKRACRSYSSPLNASTRLLDFGVGWGRITRTFARDISAQNLYGVDVYAPVLELCRKLMPVGTYTQCIHGQPLDFPEGSFDLATAFSVFSHLSPRTHLVWLEELHRVLRPGGLFVLTTLSRRYLDMCWNAANDPQASKWAADQAALVTRTFPDWRTRLKNHDPRELFFLPAGGGLEGLEPEHYGWTVVLPEYANEHWTKWFDIVEFADDPKVLAQAHFVLRRKS